MAQACSQCGFKFNCYCTLTPVLNSQYSLILLTHPNEQKRASNTGKLLIQCQLNAEQVIWDRQTPPASLWKKLTDPSMFPVLLFPAENSLELPQVMQHSEESHQVPLFIILDATWQEARKMLNKSRWLESIPTMTLNTQADSQYSLRRNQQTGNLCTFEISAELLSQLGEEKNHQLMQDFFQQYLSRFQAEKSGHPLKDVPPDQRL